MLNLDSYDESMLAAIVATNGKLSHLNDRINSMSVEGKKQAYALVADLQVKEIRDRQ